MNSQLTSLTGDITHARAYDPYGTVTSTAGTAQTSYGYTGEFTSNEMVYLRARHYAPGMGRFLTRDTWGGDANSPLSLNRWNYGYSDPVNHIDPTGLMPPPPQARRVHAAQLRFIEIASGGKNLLSLIELFEDSHLYTLGDITGRTVSKRLEWVLDMTAGFPYGDTILPIPGVQFRYSDLFGADDCYFAEEFRDNQFYQNEWFRPYHPSTSNQIGHFLTGVSLAYNNVFYWSEAFGIYNTGNLGLMIAHEKITDNIYDPLTGESKSQVLHQIFGTQVKDQDILNLLSAIYYDETGKYAERDQALWNILDFGPGQNILLGGVDPMREGNSLQDLRLDVRAWRFAWWVRDHSNALPSSGGTWLRNNLLR